jgi:hypothetical protein
MERLTAVDQLLLFAAALGFGVIQSGAGPTAFPAPWKGGGTPLPRPRAMRLDNQALLFQH